MRPCRCRVANERPSSRASRSRVTRIAGHRRTFSCRRRRGIRRRNRQRSARWHARRARNRVGETITQARPMKLRVAFGARALSRGNDGLHIERSAATYAALLTEALKREWPSAFVELMFTDDCAPVSAAANECESDYE